MPVLLLYVCMTPLFGLSVFAEKIAFQSEPEITVYQARSVITMNPSQPRATAVAVAEGRILGVGSLDDLTPWLQNRSYRIDRTFSNKYVMPGFIDNHLHPIMAALLLPMEFITPYDWHLPDRMVKGVQGNAAYLERLMQLSSQGDANAPLFAWGYHQQFHGPIDRHMLDQVSAVRPIVVWHRSFHEVYLNTAALNWLQLTREEIAGNPQVNYEQGHFFELGLRVALNRMAPTLLTPAWLGKGLGLMARNVHQGGLTTIADIAAGLFDLELEWTLQQKFLERPTTPFRVAYVADARTLSEKLGDEEAFEQIDKLPQRNTHHLKFIRAVKLFSDGAFYSQLMQLDAPGYIDGHHGEWLMTPEELLRKARPYWNAGYQIHVHANGSGGVGATLDALERLQQERPRYDHRFALHHLGYSTSAQSRRMSDLDAIASVNPYFLWALGRIYAEQGLGYDRASQMVDWVRW